MSGLSPSTMLGRTAACVSAVAVAIAIASPATAVVPSTLGNIGGVSNLGNNTFAVRHQLPKQGSFTLIDRYNSMPSQTRSFVGLGFLGGLGLLASFRPMDRRPKQG